MRIDGHALLSAMRYALHKLRCAAGGHMFTVPLPREAGEEKYSARARAVLVVCRYSVGLPLYRLQGSQAMQGVPVPDATQWDQSEKGGDWSYVVFASLETLAAQGELLSQDDPSVRMLTLSKENHEMHAHAEALGFSRAKERTGMCTTAVVVKVGERTRCLYACGRAHAGENLAALLEQRDADHGKPLVMSDALSRNEVNEASVMRCHCLAHGRRQCSDIAEGFPVECRMVLDVLTQVFAHDAEARDQQRSPQARLMSHQEESRPLMDRLPQWLQQPVDDRLVDPKSSRGKAMASMQTHWEPLPRFVESAGAPLENNVVERALQLCIRQRKHALFSRTEHSAAIASGHCSRLMPITFQRDPAGTF